MSLRRGLVLVLLVPLLALGIAQPAQANYRQRALLLWRLPGTPVIQIQIQGPNQMMQLRRVAANYDRRTPEIRVYPYGTCRAHPERVCVIVRVQDFGNTGWWGHSDADSNGSRVIRLNTRYGYHQHIACHEFGHVLGIGHHWSAGCVNDSTWAQ